MIKFFNGHDPEVVQRASLVYGLDVPITHQLDLEGMFSSRVRAIDASGIRRVFELGAKLKDPYNFSIGQPDFAVPDQIKQAAVGAIYENKNGYTVTQGIPELIRRIGAHLKDDINWNVPSDDLGVMVTSGTSGGIYLAFQALLDPGDEVIMPDPFFVIYPAIATMADAKAVLCDTYPDGRMTAERIEPLITDKTKMVLINSPGNPTGVVLSNDDMKKIVELCEARGLLLISDEIYDEFTYADAREDGKCPSPARFSDDILLVRGFGKTYGCTGWRLGYAAGPKKLIEQMAKLQQYTFVCAPSIAQVGVTVAFDVDMSTYVENYRGKRDLVLDTLGDVAEIVHPGGAFYAWVKVPEQLGLTATQFVERAIENNVLIIPGSVFSERDTHFRLSYATNDEKLTGGLRILKTLLGA